MLEIIDHPHDAAVPGGEARIREIRLARPPVNAFDAELLRAFTAAVDGAKSEAALIVSGQPGVFSAGMDVRALLALDRDGIAATFVELWRAQRAVALSPMPVIFALTGHCPAGGTVIAIHGDYRVLALGDFRVGLNEVQVGLIPGPPVILGAFRRLVGGHAGQLLMRGALVDPATALRVGLVDELCEATQVAQRALAVAREVCALPREAMLKTRQLVRADLHELFGNPSHAMLEERKFGATAAEWFTVPATQERVRKLFAKK